MKRMKKAPTEAVGCILVETWVPRWKLWLIFDLQEPSIFEYVNHSRSCGERLAGQHGFGRSRPLRFTAYPADDVQSHELLLARRRRSQLLQELKGGPRCLVNLSERGLIKVDFMPR